MKCAFCGSENPSGFKKCIACGVQPDTATNKIHDEKPSEKNADSSGTTGSTLQFGRYTIIKKLGAGGMGKIYLAQDSKMDAVVVIKEMSPMLHDEEKREYFQKQFEAEAKLLYRLSYRGIPKVTDFFSDEEKNYLVMEFIEGENFENIIKQREKHRITIEEFFKWMDQLLSTLSYLHRQEPPIIHRDIKPSNLMLNKDGDIVLVDFGLAKSLDQQSATQTQVGTLGYASPEHYTGKFSVASDIYSLGASFHYLLTGDAPNTRPPFEFPSVGIYRTDLPADVVKLLDRMLQRKLDKRYASISEVRIDFDQALKNLALNTDATEDSLSINNIKPEIQKPDSRINSDNTSSVTSGFRIYSEKPSFDSYHETQNQVKGFRKSMAVLFVTTILIFLGLFHSGVFNKRENKAASVTPSDTVQATPIVRTQDGNPDKLVIEGIQLMYDDKFSDALNNFNEAIKKAPDNATAYKNRAMIYLKFGDKKKALMDINTCLQIQPDDPEVLSARAELYLQTGKYKEAGKDLDKLLALQPNNKDNYYKRAFISNKLGNPDKAAKDLDIILAIDPSEERARTNLSRIYLKQAAKCIEEQNFKNALDYCRKLLENDPNNAKAYYLKGYAHYALGVKEAALIDFKKSLNLNPNNDDAITYLKKIENELGMPPQPPPDSQIQPPPINKTDFYPQALSGKNNGRLLPSPKPAASGTKQE